MRADFTQHLQELQHRTALLGDHLTRHHQRHAWRIRQDHVGVDTTHHVIQIDLFRFTVQLFLERFERGNFHGWQHFKGAEHQVRQVVMLNQFVDVLCQFLDTHVFIEFRRFLVQRRQNVFHTQVQVKGAFELGQRAQQAQRFGLIDPDAEQEQQIVRAGFLNDDAAFVEVFSHQTRRNTEVIHGTVFFHARRQDGDFDRVEVHVFVIDVFKAVPCAVRTQRPAVRAVDVLRLPDVKEPAFGLAFQTFDLFTELDRTFDRTVDETLTGITFHHRCRGFGGRHDTVMRRGGGVHHVGFVEGLFVDVALHVNHRCLRERRQQFVRGLGLVNHFAFNTVAAHPTFARIDWREVGVRHPGRVEVDGFHIQRLLDVVSVVQQTVIGGVSDHRMHRPGGVWCRFHTLFNGGALEFALWDTAENAVSVTGRAEVDRRNVAHHHQMGERFMAVTVDKHRAAGWSGVHANDFVRGRRTVSHHIAALSVKDAGDILFGFFVRAGMVQQRTQLGNGDGDIRFHGVRAEEIMEDAADRAFLEGGAAHVARGTEGVFAFTHVFEQRFGQRWQNSVDVFVGALADFCRNVSRCAQRILEEANLHTQIVEANVERRVAVGKSINRHVLVQRADLFTQLKVVLIPVKNHAAKIGIIFNQLQQVFTVIWVNDAEVQAFQRAMKLTNRLFFKVDAHVVHDSNNVHSHSHVSG